MTGALDRAGKIAMGRWLSPSIVALDYGKVITSRGSSISELLLASKEHNPAAAAAASLRDAALTGTVAQEH